MTPGELTLGERPVELLKGRSTITISVENAGDRPVQVGSHYHFAEANGPCSSTGWRPWGKGWLSRRGPVSALSPA